MTETIVVGHDGSEGADRALEFAVERAKTRGASIIVAHVLEWSPYSFLTPEEIEERHARRSEELKRAETALIAPIMERLSGTGVEASSQIKYGHVADTLCAIVADSDANHVVIGKTGDSTLATRLFGSVAGTLVQASPVPVTIVP